MTRRNFRFDTSNPTVAASSTTLAAAVTSTGQAVISLAAPCGPNGTQLGLASERVLVLSGGLSTSPTVQRGFGGTTAATYANGDPVDLPGHNVFTLREISEIPNQEVRGAKSTSDINYQVIECGGSDTFPSGATSLILADNSPERGTLNLLAAVGGNIWMQFPSAGAPGPSESDIVTIDGVPLTY